MSAYDQTDEYVFALQEAEAEAARDEIRAEAHERAFEEWADQRVDDGYERPTMDEYDDWCVAEAERRDDERMW